MFGSSDSLRSVVMNRIAFGQSEGPQMVMVHADGCKSDKLLNVSFGEIQTRTQTVNDYNLLNNKPLINGHELTGDSTLESLGLRAIYYDTKANWDAQLGLLSEEGALYVYSDYYTVYDEMENPTYIPALKIGDGVSFLVDLPVLSDNSEEAVRDYMLLQNKPTINNITLEGNMSLFDFGIRPIYYDTTANWNQCQDLIPEVGAIYIYNDYKTIYDRFGNPTHVNGVKIGDGTTYLRDIAFMQDSEAQLFQEYLSRKQLLVTPEDRIFWNNKVSARLSIDDPEALNLTIN